ncbi:MAG: hypothetical protein RR740_00685 [Pseudomonas sp.]
MKAIITGFSMKAGCPDETEIEFSLDNGDSVGFNGALTVSFAGYLTERCTGVDEELLAVCNRFLEEFFKPVPDYTQLLGLEFGSLEDTDESI